MRFSPRGILSAAPGQGDGFKCRIILPSSSTFIGVSRALLHHFILKNIYLYIYIYIYQSDGREQRRFFLLRRCHCPETMADYCQYESYIIYI